MEIIKIKTVNAKTNNHQFAGNCFYNNTNKNNLKVNIDLQCGELKAVLDIGNTYQYQ